MEKRLVMKIVLAAAVTATVLAVLLGSALRYHRAYFEEYLLKEINESSSYLVSAERISLAFFPLASVTLHGASVEYRIREKSVKVISAEQMTVVVSWKTIFANDLKIRDIRCEQGEINVFHFLLSGKDSGKYNPGHFSDFRNLSLNDVRINLYDSEGTLRGGDINRATMARSLYFKSLTLESDGFKKKGSLRLDVRLDSFTSRDDGFRGDHIPSPVSFTSESDYSFMDGNIVFRYAHAACDNVIEADMEGSLSMGEEYALRLSVEAREMFPYPLVSLIADLSELVPQREGVPGPRFIARMDVRADSLWFRGHRVSDFSTKVDIDDNVIRIDGARGYLYQGVVNGSGKVITASPARYGFHVLMENVDLGRIKYSDSGAMHATGAMRLTSDISSTGDSFAALRRNLRAGGRITVSRGELLGYADILKPLFSLGKLVNFLGPKGKSTGFDTLTVDYSVAGERVAINSLKMKGVGLDANGQGSVYFNGAIDMRIVVGIGGITGKVIKVPVIYKGKLFESRAYVEPLWLGTVYVGMAVFAGPPGAVIGPVVYDSVRNWFNELTSDAKKKKE